MLTKYATSKILTLFLTLACSLGVNCGCNFKNFQLNLNKINDFWRFLGTGNYVMIPAWPSEVYHWKSWASNFFLNSVINSVKIFSVFGSFSVKLHFPFTYMCSCLFYCQDTVYFCYFNIKIFGFLPILLLSDLWTSNIICWWKFQNFPIFSKATLNMFSITSRQSIFCCCELDPFQMVSYWNR